MKSYDVPVIFRVKAINKDAADARAASIVRAGILDSVNSSQDSTKARLKWWNFATIRSTKGGPT